MVKQWLGSGIVITKEPEGVWVQHGCPCIAILGLPNTCCFLERLILRGCTAYPRSLQSFGKKAKGLVRLKGGRRWTRCAWQGLPKDSPPSRPDALGCDAQLHA